MRFFLSLSSGIILFYAFPPFTAGYLAFFGFIPLFASSKEDSGSNFFFGTIAGFVFYSLSFFWLYRLAGFFYLLLSLYLSLYWGLFLYLLYKLPSNGRIFTGMFIWFFLEIIVSYLLTGFPWLLLGLSQWQEPRMLKTAGFCGIYGVSCLVILINLTIFHAFRRKYFLSFLLSIVIFVAIFILPLEKTQKMICSGTLKVMVVQPNIVSEENKQPEQIFELLRKLTSQNLKGSDTVLVVWPEGSFPDIFERYPSLVRKMRDLSHRYSLNILMGTFCPAQEGVYNSAVMFNNSLLQVYNKNHLVPYGEFILGGRYAVINNIFKKTAGYLPNVNPGKQQKVFDVNGKKIAPLICFENIFPEMTRQYDKNGAEVFIVLTNDSWYGMSAGPYQHFAHNIFRAVESGKYFIQAALTGISGIVSSEGKIVKVIEEDGKKMKVQGLLFYTVPMIQGKTFYSQFGDLPLFLLGIFFIGVILCRWKN